MRSVKLPLAILLLLGLTTPLLAQTCVYDWTQDYEQLTRLTDQFNATTGDGDSLTIPTLGSTLSGEKETWYVPRRESSGCPTGTAGFYREYNSSLQDHRDTPTPGDLSGYLSDINLGCPWTSSSARQGLTSIRRYFKSSINDHKTWLSTAPAGYTLDANFSSGLTARYGYQRFGNELSRGDVLSVAYDTYSLTNGVLTIDFNKIWGNSIGRITFGTAPNTKQIVREGLGAQVQTVTRFTAGQDTACGIPNPTQSGGHNCSNTDTTQWAGSPVISTTVNGTDPSPQTLTSVVRPLDYCTDGDPPHSWPNADADSPTIWRGFFRRADTLSCRLGTVVRKDVLKTTSEVMMGEGSGRTSNTGNLLNTHWLKEEVIGDAKNSPGSVKIEKVDLATGVATPISVAYDATANDFRLNGSSTSHLYSIAPTAPTALMVTKSDGSFGYAIVMLNPQTATGDVLDVSLLCGTSCEPTNVTIILRATRPFSSWNTTSWSTPLDSFLVVNNRNTILTRLQEVYSDGGDCVN